MLTPVGRYGTGAGSSGGDRRLFSGRSSHQRIKDVPAVWTRANSSSIRASTSSRTSVSGASAVVAAFFRSLSAAQSHPDAGDGAGMTAGAMVVPARAAWWCWSCGTVVSSSTEHLVGGSPVSACRASREIACGRKAAAVGSAARAVARSGGTSTSRGPIVLVAVCPQRGNPAFAS